MEWTKEASINLIERYHKKAIIWDPQHPDHFNKIKKQDAWMEIAADGGQTVEQCKKKMENLLASLRREKMKIKKSKGTGTGAHEVYKSNWFAFESMQFILDKNKTKPSLNTMQSNRDEETYPQEETEPSVEAEASTEADAPASQDEESTSIAKTPQSERIIETQTPRNSRQKKRKLNTASDTERLDQAFQLLQSSANQINANQDECYYFGNFVASKLRACDASTRSAVENDIMNIFLSVNNGRYNMYSYPRLPQTLVNPTNFSENYINYPGSSSLPYNSQNTSVHNLQNSTKTVPAPLTSTSSKISQSSQSIQTYDAEHCSSSSTPTPVQVLSPSASTYSDDFSIQDLL